MILVWSADVGFLREVLADRLAPVNTNNACFNTVDRSVSYPGLVLERASTYGLGVMALLPTKQEVWKKFISAFLPICNFVTLDGRNII